MADEDQKPGILERAAGPLVVASIVGIAGAWVASWDSIRSNSLQIAQLKRFAEKGDRCTWRDCSRLETQVAALEEELKSHDEKDAHREAHWRLKQLEQDVGECRAALDTALSEKTD